MKRITPSGKSNVVSPSQISHSSFKSFTVPNSSSTRSTNSIHKTSVRKLLEEKATLNDRKDNLTVNLVYNDIKAKNEGEIKEEIQSFLCYKGLLNRPQRCKCFDGKKCEWVAKWIFMFPEIRFPNSGQISENLAKQIDIDLERTSNNVSYLQEGEFKKVVRKTLVAYCLSDPEVNYVQGFNYLVGSIAVHTKNFTDTFRVFCYVMKNRNLREIYLKDFYIAKKHAKRMAEVLRVKSYSLYVYMLKQNIDLDMFFLGWIVPLFSNLVSQEYMHLVIDGFLVKDWTFVYAFCLTLIIYLRQQILQMECQEDIFMLLSVQALLNRGIPWEQIARTSYNFRVTNKELYSQLDNTISN